MISGPIVPTNGEGLLALLQSDPARIETGLRLVATGLELDGGLVVDALGCDALGHPVVIVLAEEGDATTHRELPAHPGEVATADVLVRVVTLHRWFVRYARYLSGLIPGVAFPAGANVRILVLGVRVDAAVVAGIRGLALPDVQLLQVDVFRIAGRTCFGVDELTSGDRVDERFGLPAAFLIDDRHGSIATLLLDLLRKLDSTLEVRGDRYGRRFYCRGTFLAELRMQQQGLTIRLGEGSARPLTTQADVAAWFDRVARRYIEIVSDRSGAQFPNSALRGGEAVEWPQGPEPHSDTPEPEAVRPGVGVGLGDRNAEVRHDRTERVPATSHDVVSSSPILARAEADAKDGAPAGVEVRKDRMVGGADSRAAEGVAPRNPGRIEPALSAFDVELSEDEFNALQQPGAGPEDGSTSGRAQGGVR